MRYTCRKTYGHEQGLSCVFRQHRAKSHCAMLHGYALSFSFEFETNTLDENGWVMDFGALKPLKEWLGRTFDHTLVVAENDPEQPFFEAMARRGLADVRTVSRVGCEAFARLAWEKAEEIVASYTNGRVGCLSVTCAEHGANSATYTA